MLGLLAVLALAAHGGQRAESLAPYNPEADPHAELAAAKALAAREGRLLLVVFGANWCGDCRAFDAAARQGELATLLDAHFVLAKVDVGNWDHNLDVVEAWGDPIAGGIPAIVVAQPDETILYASKAGDLARARHMDEAGLVSYFQRLLAVSQGERGADNLMHAE